MAIDWIRDKVGGAVDWVRENPGTAALTAIGAPVMAAANLPIAGAAADLKGVMLGEQVDPSGVALPPGYDQALQRREGLLAQIQRQAQGMDSPAMQRAGVLGQQLAQQQQSQAAGVRGFGALGALQSAARNTALGQQGIAAGANIQAGQEQRAAQNVLLQAANQDLQRAFLEDEYRRAIAAGESRPGALPAFLGTGGALLGGLYSGPQGAAAGGQLGYGLGQGVLAAGGYA